MRRWAMHLRTVLILVAGVALGHACTPDPGQTCTPGTDACVCAEGELCFGGLECVGGSCQPEPVETSALTDDPPVPTTSALDGTSTTGPGTNTSGPDPSTSSTAPDLSSSSGEPVDTVDTVDPSGTSSTTSGDTTTDGTTGEPMGGTVPVQVWYKIGEFGEAHDVDFTPDGDVAVVGYVERVPFDEDAWMGVLDPKGVLKWEKLYDGPGNLGGRSDEFHAVAVDGKGNITAAGQTTEAEYATQNILSMSWNSQQSQLQLRIHGHIVHGEDIAWGVAVDMDGNPYVCAYESPKPMQPTSWNIRYNDYSGGTWNKFGANEAVYDCEATASGQLVVVARAGANASFRRYAALDGASLGTGTYKLEGSEANYAHGVAIDPADGNAYVTGYSSKGFGTEPSPFVGRLSGTSLSWVDHPIPEGKSMIPQDLVVDVDGNLRVIGATKVANVLSLFILTYDTSGKELDRTVFTAPEGDIRPIGVATRGDALFIVGATTYQNPRIFLAKYAI